MQTSSAEGNTSHGAKGSRTGYTPFSKQNNLEKVSETSSLTSEGSQAANPCPHGLCSCASLEQWSSLQLSQQHLLASNCNTSSEPATNSKCAGSQDMVVLVLPRTDQEAAAAGGTAADKPKPRMSGVSIAASTGQQSTSGVVTHWVHEVGWTSKHY